MASRRFFSYAPVKTVHDFLAYYYDNGHEGTFPLDCRPHSGIPKKNPGCYGLFEKLNHVAGDMSESDSDSEADIAAMNRYDQAFQDALLNHPF